MWTLLIMVLLAYLLGSVSGSLLLGMLRHVDIRTMGSGNAGGTNAFRTQGLLFALGVVVIDIGKGVLAAGVLPGLAPSQIPGSGVGNTLAMACGVAAVLGHCYPAWHGFRGGKGAATTVGALIVINPWLLVPMLGTWVLTLFLTGYVGLATVLAGIVLLPAAWWLDDSGALTVFVTLLAALMAFTHRSNFYNMAAGTEHRFERVWIGRWLGGRRE